jgi:shikimate dehydrogenase
MSKRYKLGVLGNTLSHSKSPDIQIAGLEYLGLDGSYGKYEIDPDNFNKEINQLLSELDGLNVTIPYKEKILKYLNKKDILVSRIGATNTLTMTSLGIYGYNTDHYGFTESLKGINLKNKTATILGSGGASKAIIVALNDLGVSKINVLVRNLDKAELNIPNTNTDLELQLNTEDLELKDTDILINCTPIGQGRLSDDMPVTIKQLNSLPKTSCVYDLIYNETLLLKTATELGLSTINGSEMLILQGVKSLSIWTGADITEGLIKAMRGAFHSNKG